MEEFYVYIYVAILVWKESTMYQHVFYNYLEWKEFCIDSRFHFLYSLHCLIFQKDIHMSSKHVKKESYFGFQDKKRNIVEHENFQWNMELQYRKVGVWFVLRDDFLFCVMCRRIWAQNRTSSSVTMLVGLGRHPWKWGICSNSVSVPKICRPFLIQQPTSLSERKNLPLYLSIDRFCIVL